MSASIATNFTWSWNSPPAVDLDGLTREVGGAMPGFLAAEYARTVASVLRMAHQLGGVHGDVRPANLLVGRSPSRPVPMALTIGDPPPMRYPPRGTRPGPTSTGRCSVVSRCLTPPTFRPNASMGPRSNRGDLYALGATLCFLLTGGRRSGPRSPRNS